MGFLKKLKQIFGTILKIVAVAAALVIIALVLAPIVTAIAAAISTVIPYLSAAVSAIGKWVWGIGSKVLPLVKKGLNALETAYNTWVKPALTSVIGAVKAIKEALNKTYTITIGTVTKTYNTLFGWVGGVQATFNEIMDKTKSLISVVDKKTADKIDKFQRQVNETIQKYTSDIFDKVINKINEIVTPILKQVNDFTAAVTNKLSIVDNTFNDMKKYAEVISPNPYIMDGETTQELDTATRHAEEPIPPPPETEEVITPKPVEKETAFDRIIERWTSSILKDTEDVMGMVEQSINAAVNDIDKETFLLPMSIDKDVSELQEGNVDDDILLWLMGEISLGTVIKHHWADVLFHQRRPKTRQEAINYMNDRIQEMREQGLPEETIEDYRNNEMNRINKKFGVPERGF